MAWDIAPASWGAAVLSAPYTDFVPAWPTPEENGNYIKTAMQNGPTKATVRNAARGDLFIARARPRFILFFSGAVAEGIAVLRKIWPAPASEPCRRTAPLKNKENDSMAQVTINRSPLRGLSGQLDIRVRSRILCRFSFFGAQRAKAAEDCRTPRRWRDF